MDGQHGALDESSSTSTGQSNGALCGLNSQQVLLGRTYRSCSVASMGSMLHHARSSSPAHIEPSNCRSFLSSASEASSLVICRICHEGESREELVSPCHCAGTMAMIHLSCIEKWLSAVNSDTCEICGFKYITQTKKRSLNEWLSQPSQHRDKRNLMGDIICFMLLTPLAAVSAWLCITGALHYARFDEAKWETVGLITLTAFLILIYLTWCGVAIKYHVRVYREWLHKNPIVKVLPRPEAGVCDENNNLVSPANTSQTGAESVFTDVPLGGITASLPSHLQDHLLPIAASSPLTAADMWVRAGKQGTPRTFFMPHSVSTPRVTTSDQSLTTTSRRLEYPAAMPAHPRTSGGNIWPPFRETYV